MFDLGYFSNLIAVTYFSLLFSWYLMSQVLISSFLVLICSILHLGDKKYCKI